MKEGRVGVMERSGGRAFQAEGQPVKRPWGRTLPGMLEEQPRGSWGWSRVSEVGRREGSGQSRGQEEGASLCCGH